MPGVSEGGLGTQGQEMGWFSQARGRDESGEGEIPAYSRILIGYQTRKAMDWVESERNREITIKESCPHA